MTKPFGARPSYPPGPVAPGETACTQFTWEDVPYSNYKICVTVNCTGDGNAENDEMCSEILVLEDLEHASKVEGVGYNECEPEAWCLSNVVGNDCGNDGAGDLYALATNCDSPFIPEGVQDWVALEGIDVSHLNFAGGGGGETGVLLEQPPNMDAQELPFSSDYYPYRCYDNFELAQKMRSTGLPSLVLKRMAITTLPARTSTLGSLMLPVERHTKTKSGLVLLEMKHSLDCSGVLTIFGKSQHRSHQSRLQKVGSVQ